MKHGSCCQSSSSLPKMIHTCGGSYFIQFAIGAMFLFGGIGKISGGLGNFADAMSAGFANAILPVGVFWAVLYILPILETVIGAWLISGYQRLYALFACNKLLALLILGHLFQGDKFGAIANLVMATFAITYAFNVVRMQEKHNSSILKKMEDTVKDAMDSLK